MNKDTIELLGEDYIQENKDIALDILGYASKFCIGLGWHYVLDLIWITKNLNSEDKIILDAGGGAGLLQFILSLSGKKVISADVGNRDRVIKKFENVFDISYIEKWPNETANSQKSKPTISLINADLKNLEMIEDNSVDAVVSVSAIEHNSPEDVKKIIKELSRVLKNDKKMLITVSAYKDNYYHTQSNSWVLNEQGLIDAYDLKNPESNFKDDYKKIAEGIDNSTFLKKWLWINYYQDSASKAIAPGNDWAPSYYPVGIIKTL